MFVDRKDEAIEVMRNMCKQNEVSMPEGEMVCTEQRRGEYKDMFIAPHTKYSKNKLIN